MKTVYFVRHGQSEGNIGAVFQRDDSPLTDHGKKQARFVSERCSRLSIEYLVASPQPRAQHTATIISEKIGLPVETSELFRERRKPSELEGKLHSDPEARALNQRWWQSLAGDGSRVADGENFADLSERAGKALDLLAQRSEQSILVVTHGFYLRYLVGRAIFGESMTSGQFEPLMRALWVENTGITALRHNKPTSAEEVIQRGQWSLWTWNDHAHLG